MEQQIRFCWDSPVFTTLFVPEASVEQMHWFNDLQRISTSPENAIRIQNAAYHIDVRDLALEVDVPSLVLHAQEDATVPFEEGRLLASLIPDTRFVALQGKNHILLEDEPAWPRFLAEVRSFLGVEAAKAVSTPSSSHGLDTDQWDRLSALFKKIVALGPDGRTAVLDEACADDPVLRRELVELLEVDARSGLSDGLAGILPASPASSSNDDLEGRTVSHYEILGRLGGGGMGVVYRAHDTRLDRTVALKFLPSYLNPHAQARRRFLQEAKAASALDYPHTMNRLSTFCSPR